MLRVLLVILWIAVVVYAVADWARTPEEKSPGPIPRMVWLLIILLTAPTFALGAIAWIVARVVSRAEDGEESAFFGPLRKFNIPGFGGQASDAGVMSPDDDPEFLFRLQRDIQRRRSAGNAAEAPETGQAETSKESDGQNPDNEDFPPSGLDGLYGQPR